MDEIQPVDWAVVDEKGRLVLPAEVARQHGLEPGARMRLESSPTGLRLHNPAVHLGKVYIEVTNRCNLSCRTCIRHNWDEPLGRMRAATFDSLLNDLSRLPSPPLLFFGGMGEPLAHPRIADMVAKAHQAGLRVELITNGTLLSAERSRALLDAGLDRLWVSIDGATPESYADVRLGAALPRVLENLATFRQMRRPGHRAQPEIGIAFVAMRRNIRDLPAVIALGKRLGAVHFMVSNVLPYTPEMQAERLYANTTRSITYLPSGWLPDLSLPKMDLDDTTSEIFLKALDSGCNVSFAGFNLGGANDVCSFLETGSLAVGWDGTISPCIALLHDFTSYLHGKPRANHRHVVGQVGQGSLMDIWRDPVYLAYREKVQGFGFAPCTACGGCDLSESNLSDCLGNEFPSCGGCLWAQAVIQCP
jgi:MoaA/NifB/PqqE/SkfB family radical SAM enzyme